MNINDFYALANRVYEMYDNGVTTEDLQILDHRTDGDVQELFGKNYTLADARYDCSAVEKMMELGEAIQDECLAAQENPEQGPDTPSDAAARARWNTFEIAGEQAPLHDQEPCANCGHTKDRHYHVSDNFRHLHDCWDCPCLRFRDDHDLGVSGEQSPETSETLLEAEEDGDEN